MAAFAAPLRAFTVSQTRSSTRNLMASHCTSIPSEDSNLHNAEQNKGIDDQMKNKTVPFFPKRAQELELVCESLAFGGQGVCKVAETGFVVMCNRALPGERFNARITKRKGSYAEALKLNTITVHDNAVSPPCEYSGNCGGCRMQNLSYEAQLAAKEDQVHQLISRVGRFGHGSYFKTIVPCINQYHYRNKMEFSFGPALRENANDFALGLHVPGRYDKILNIKECLLQHKVANQVLQEVHAFCESSKDKLSAYDTNTRAGYLRHFIIRSGHDEHTGNLQLMVNFVTSEYKPGILRPLMEKLASYPEVTSILNNVTTSISNIAVGEQEYVLYGTRTITERLRGLVFEISANSFFQTNTAQAEVLYQIVEDACNLKKDSTEIMLDLFCGTGTIGLSMAKYAKHVYGYELVQDAVADARRNSIRNNIHNASFIQGDLNKLPSNFESSFPCPDIIITDPTRPGMHPKLIQFMLKAKPSRIVYVSCNPATCARDLDKLCHKEDGADLPGGYRLTSVQPVDMFPHTPHVECVCSLELNS